VNSLLEFHRASSPLLVSAYEELLRQMPFLQPSLGALIRSQDAGFWAQGEMRCREVLHLGGGDSAQLRRSVSAWVDFSIEYLTRQNAFLQSGRYGCTDFDQVRRQLYDNTERMQNGYLPALMLSFVFSANYVGYFRFFRSEMLPRIQGARTLCDVGCGHGVYLSQMLLAAGSAVGAGFDISPASVAATRALLQFHGVENHRCVVEQADVRESLPVDDGTQQGVTCFEVLEHLDRPLAALAEIRRILAPGAPLCISTAVRMESIDHLYVFDSPDEVRSHLHTAGFTIVEDRCYPLDGSHADEVKTAERASNSGDALGFVALAVRHDVNG
jgi:2-polyprenyl-3-methyl-5-hydroxy-6-metoxy-1,4-benzoquinol methylase